MKRNAIGWFEIPTSNMDRAKAFYETVFTTSIEIVEMGPFIMGWFPDIPDAPGASGSLVYHEDYTPSTNGTLIYFSSKTGDLADELSKVESAGGKVLQPKTMISEEHGYMAIFLDTEGNRLALHSNG